jgi:microcin C transport system substrate-binding protein
MLKKGSVIAAAAALAAVGGLAAVSNAQVPSATGWLHGITLMGDLKYPAGFAHFDYVNPDAPKGGIVRFAALGTFDTLNGVPAEGTSAGGLGLIYDGLMTGTLDESSSQYVSLAEGLRYAEDFSWATYKLREDAYWHDGVPITVEDVLWTFEVITENDPNTAQYYSHVERLEQTGDWEFTFFFDEAGNRELPTIVGQLGVLPKHYWDGVDENGVQRDIREPTLVPPLGSGAYRIKTVDPGRSIVYERVPDYWGADLNVNVGMNNFDEIHIEYFLDETVEFEAFKADQYDFRSEYIARRWANEYNFPAALDGRVVLEWVETEIDYGEVVGYMWNIVYRYIVV